MYLKQSAIALDLSTVQPLNMNTLLRGVESNLKLVKLSLNRAQHFLCCVAQQSRVHLHILVTRASDLMAAHDPRLWETLQEFSQNLAIWTSRRMLLEQTGN